MLRSTLLCLALVMGISLQARTLDSDMAVDQRGEGFYFYEDPESNTTRPVPVNPRQKMQAQMMQELIKEIQENNRLQRKILAKLEYAYPRTVPEFTRNAKTGERCRSNINADCFVMPVIAEAQNSVPVLAQMLQNPTADNVKEYIRWQSKYFNQSFKVGQGFNLMSKQYEREIHQVDGMGFTQLPDMQDKQNDMAYLARTAAVKRLDSKLGVMLFVGNTREIEKNFNGPEYSAPLHTVFGKMQNLTYVFKSRKDLDFVTSKLERFKYDEDTKRFREARKVVDPKQFDRFKINATPSSVVVYKKDDGSVAWQKMGYTIEPQSMLRMIYQFLEFHGIIKPGTINEKFNWDASNQIRTTGSMSEKTIDSIEIDESNTSGIPDDQYIKRSQEQ